MGLLGTISVDEMDPWAEFHQPLQSHFSLLVDFFIRKVQVNNRVSRVLRLVNLTHGWYSQPSKRDKGVLMFY